MKRENDNCFNTLFTKACQLLYSLTEKSGTFSTRADRGNYKERRVCKLDLITGGSEDSTARLDRYLNYESIRTGEAIRANRARLPERLKTATGRDEFARGVDKVGAGCRRISARGRGGEIRKLCVGISQPMNKC